MTSALRVFRQISKFNRAEDGIDLHSRLRSFNRCCVIDKSDAFVKV